MQHCHLLLRIDRYSWEPGCWILAIRQQVSRRSVVLYVLNGRIHQSREENDQICGLRSILRCLKMKFCTISLVRYSYFWLVPFPLLEAMKATQLVIILSSDKMSMKEIEEENILFCLRFCSQVWLYEIKILSRPFSSCQNYQLGHWCFWFKVHWYYTLMVSKEYIYLPLVKG